MSFCLADGALLSPPYSERIEEPSATAVLPTRQPRSIPPTQAAPNLDIPTIAIRPPLQSIADDSLRPKRNSRIWVLTAIVFTLIVFAAAIFVYENNKSNEVAATDIQPAINDPNKLLSTPAVSPTGAKVLTAEIDDNRTFSGNEVDSRVQILERPDPTYTDTARQNRITGIVVLRAVFSSAGQVTNVHAVSGLPDGLTERAIVAAKNIRFVPATKEGHPVSMWMELQYKFNL